VVPGRASPRFTTTVRRGGVETAAAAVGLGSNRTATATGFGLAALETSGLRREHVAAPLRALPIALPPGRTGVPATTAAASPAPAASFFVPAAAAAAAATPRLGKA